MSHAEYAPRPIPVFTKLAVMLRNLPAVRFVATKFANLLRSNKTAEQTQISPFLGDAALDVDPGASEKGADFVEFKAVDQTVAPPADAFGETEVSRFVGGAAPDEAPRASEPAVEIAELKAVDHSATAPEALDQTQVSRFVGDAVPDDDVSRASDQPANFIEPKAVSEAAAPEANDQSDREHLIRRRWAETGIKMWSGRSALNIQGRAGVLPANPGETLPRYDTLEYRLIAGQIVCEGVVVDPPQPRK